MRHLKSCAGFRDVVASIGCRIGYRWALLLSLMQRALAAPDPLIFHLRVVSMHQHLGLIAHVEQRSADRAFVEMIGLGSISQPTGLKAHRPGAWEATRPDVVRERPVPCTALRSASERALTVDHIALGSIIWRTLQAGDAKN
jgi:hypothetical protein